MLYWIFQLLVTPGQDSSLNFQYDIISLFLNEKNLAPASLFSLIWRRSWFLTTVPMKLPLMTALCSVALKHGCTLKATVLKNPDAYTSSPKPLFGLAGIGYKQSGNVWRLWKCVKYSDALSSPLSDYRFGRCFAYSSVCWYLTLHCKGSWYSSHTFGMGPSHVLAFSPKNAITTFLFSSLWLLVYWKP